MPFNIGGYVCLLFSLIWGVACVAIMEFIHPLIHKLLTFLPRPLGIGLIVIFTIILFADLYVTASEIFKFNRKLEAMEKIAQELHEISDQIGSDIYEKTVLAMETASDIKEKHRETLDELKERQQQALDELKERQLQALDELKEKNELLQERRDAFKEHLEELRETAGDFADRIDFREFTEDLRDRSMELSEDMKTRISALRPVSYTHLPHPPTLLLYGTQLSRRRSFTSTFDISGYLESTQATAPDTIGVAIDVPLFSVYGCFHLFIYAPLQLVMYVPGATKSGLTTQFSVGPLPE